METHWKNFKASSSYSQRSHFYRKTSAQTECIYRHSDTRGAKQPAKLSYSCFQEWNDVALQTFYQEDQIGVWKRQRLIAADGSTLCLPESADTLLIS